MPDTKLEIKIRLSMLNIISKKIKLIKEVIASFIMIIKINFSNINFTKQRTNRRNTNPTASSDVSAMAVFLKEEPKKQKQKNSNSN